MQVGYLELLRGLGLGLGCSKPRPYVQSLKSQRLKVNRTFWNPDLICTHVKTLPTLSKHQTQNLKPYALNLSAPSRAQVLASEQRKQEGRKKLQAAKDCGHSDKGFGPTLCCLTFLNTASLFIGLQATGFRRV